MKFGVLSVRLFSGWFLRLSVHFPLFTGRQEFARLGRAKYGRALDRSGPF